MIISATVLLAIHIGVTVDIAEKRMNTTYDKNHLRNERDIIIWTKGEKSNLRRQKFRWDGVLCLCIASLPRKRKTQDASLWAGRLDFLVIRLQMMPKYFLPGS